MDGNSTDGTKEYLQNLEKPFYTIIEPDTGIYDAMNKGIRHAKGNWLYFLGADDQLMSKDVLKEVAVAFEDTLDIVSGKIQYDYSENDSAFVKKNNGVFVTRWSKKLWIKNTVHHQSTFYSNTLFKNNLFNLDYKVLADYAFNLELFKKKSAIKTVDMVVALCGTEGVSKNYTWSLYKEEIRFKTKASSWILYPLFLKLAILKYWFK